MESLLFVGFTVNTAEIVHPYTISVITNTSFVKVDMSALLTLLKNDPAAVEKLEVHQLSALCGNGKLTDGSVCSVEFREYLAIAKSEKLFEYADACLSQAPDKSGQILQDVVNELGRRLDYTVENGLYQGKPNAAGNDGLWKDNNGSSIVIEVKTTDSYRINLDTIASYIAKLRTLNKIGQNAACSILLIVGRQDTGDLEAQVRGSRHAWTIRIISIDALKKLVSLKEGAESATVHKIHELLVPFEYTRLDRIIEIAFTVVEETGSSVEEEVATGESSHNGKLVRDNRISSKEDIEALRSLLVEKLSASSVPLVKKSRALYWSADKAKRVAITISKKYPGGDYWYAYHFDWDEFLGQGAEGLYILGCIGRPEAFVIPYEWIHARLDRLHVTERDGSKHFHISLYPQSNGELKLHLKTGEDVPLEAFRIQVAV